MVLPDPLIGRKLGDYKIVALLGKGGMARVYKGFDEALQRYAAVKVITGEFATADEAEYTARFQREARAIARLHHPNIVSIYQFGQVEGMYYMAMVFLDGKDLRIMLKEAATRGERIPPLIILKMAREICSALDYAHTQGVIHRDIKPSNIMMTTNGAVLTDFGLALTTMEGTLGDTFGSAHYIAPEQAVSSARAVPQSDLYSFGVVLYEALTGKVPFDDPSAMTVALKHLNEEPPPPTFYNPDLPSEVEKVLLMALHKDPRQRYATCHDLYLALDVALKRTEDEDTVEISTNSGPKKSAAQPHSPAALEAYLKTLRHEPPKPTTQGVQTVGDV
ncbi:MAG: serine/threonine protein kinase, partial [Anaerolineae bacterium]